MKYLLLLYISIALYSCDSPEPPNFELSATSKALEHYKQGWVQIMDEGHYAKAEASYQKALAYDPDFLIGKSVLARLTLDLKERLAMYKEIQAQKHKTDGDERLVLDVYTALVNYTNLRDQKSSDADLALQKALVIAENNLRKIVHKYPDEIYLKAEYIEILNSLYGAKQALDSLDVLTTAAQKDNPFLLGFSASRHAELKVFDIAIQQANRLKIVVNDSAVPKTYAILADVYFQMGNLKLAKSNADSANKLDGKNLDASRLKRKIEKAIKEQRQPISSGIK